MKITLLENLIFVSVFSVQWTFPTICKRRISGQLVVKYPPQIIQIKIFFVCPSDATSQRFVILFNKILLTIQL